MAFQIKDFVSISASMVNYAKATQDKLTDFNIGSAARTMLDAPSIEIEELYQRMFAGIMDAIPVAIYRAFGFDALSAVTARGTVMVQFGGPISVAFEIPAGTIFRAPESGLTYLSSAAVAVGVGATSAFVMVVSTAAGSTGNLPAGAISEAVNFTMPTGSVITSEAITSGRDGESDEDRLSRFNDFIQSLSRGTLPSLLYAASAAVVKSGDGLTTEFVSRVGSQERPGWVQLYIHGSNGAASDALVAAAQQIIDGYRTDNGLSVAGYAAAGTRVEVIKMTERAVDVGLVVTVVSPSLKNDDTKLAIRSLLVNEFDQVESGELLKIDALTDAALSASGVLSAYSTNNENILCASGEVLVLGNLDVEWVDA